MQSSECLDRIVLRYVEEMISKKHTFEKKTVQRMKEDEKILYDAFLRDTNMEEKQIAVRLQVLEDLRELLDTNVGGIGSCFQQLLEHSPDITLEIVESLLAKRSDLSKTQAKEAMEACENIFAQKHKDNEKESDKGIFTRIQQKPQSGLLQQLAKPLTLKTRHK
jgi:hypothetical protein